LEESIKLFDLNEVGKSPSKLDMSRILSLNEHYIKHINEKELFEFFKDHCKKFKKNIDSSKEKALLKSMNFLKNKAKTLDDIYQNAQYILNDVIKISSEDLKLLDSTSKKILKDFLSDYEKMTNITKESLEKIVNGLIDKHKTNFKGIGQPLRVALTGSKFGPGLYNIILSLDKNETIKRLKMIK
jgi:glutamyl-tRNA synthetase